MCLRFSSLDDRKDIELPWNMTLKAKHVDALAMVGRSGGSWFGLASLVSVRDLFDLEGAGYLRRDPVERMQIWHLTERGAEVAGIDAARLS